VFNDGYGVHGVDGDAFFILYNDVYNHPSGDYGGAIWPRTGLFGNISEPPQLVDWSMDGDFGNDDFHLQAGSPCIDAGNPIPQLNDVDGTVNDMGAYGGPYGAWP